MSVTIDGSASVTINSGAVLGITSGTAVASTSGTSIDFTGIPSWVKRITVMLDGVSLNSAIAVVLQIGDSGGVETSGYVASGSTNGASSAAGGTYFWAGVRATAAATHSSTLVLNLLNASTNTWNMTGTNYSVDSTDVWSLQGTKSLSATLDRVRITSTNGTATFDAGTINILYE